MWRAVTEIVTGANAGNADAMKLDIRHDPGRGRFVASLGGEEATLLYTEARSHMKITSIALKGWLRLLGA